MKRKNKNKITPYTWYRSATHTKDVVMTYAAAAKQNPKQKQMYLDSIEFTIKYNNGIKY